jgi:hypothetical protein
MEVNNTLKSIYRTLVRAVMGLLILGILGIGLWTYASLKFSFASGERAGYVQKLSKRGWVCKTWEGELAMVNLPGAMPQIFEFTVPDEQVAQKIGQSAGQQVILHYEQHRGVPSSCFGDTEYFVTSVTPVAQEPKPAPAPQK